MSKVKYISDCCGAVVRQIDDKHGICTRCDKECWACDTEMLKPLTLEQVKASTPFSQFKEDAGKKKENN